MGSGSRRVVPMHPKLIRIGFIEFAHRMRQEHGDEARLFPLLTRGPRGGYGSMVQMVWAPNSVTRY
jgi:hypothetical protein